MTLHPYFTAEKTQNRANHIKIKQLHVLCFRWCRIGRDMSIKLCSCKSVLVTVIVFNSWLLWIENQWASILQICRSSSRLQRNWDGVITGRVHLSVYWVTFFVEISSTHSLYATINPHNYLAKFSIDEIAFLIN